MNDLDAAIESLDQTIRGYDQVDRDWGGLWGSSGCLNALCGAVWGCFAGKNIKTHMLRIVKLNKQEGIFAVAFVDLQDSLNF